MKYVFMCSHGEYRSAIAATAAQEFAREQGTEIETDYIGANDNLPNSEKRGIVRDADRVFVMERHMVFDVKEVLHYTGPVEVLEIPDDPKITEEDIKIRVYSYLSGKRSSRS